MKIIFNNKYIEIFKMESFREFSIFVNNQNIKKKISLNEPYGDHYYCYIFYDSLTKEKSCIVDFHTDQPEKNLNLLIWKNTSFLVLDTGMNLYLIDNEFNVKTSFEILSPIIGLHITSGNNLLILEEASVRVIQSNGQIIKTELFDFIEDFNLQEDILSIKTNVGSKVFKLI